MPFKVKEIDVDGKESFFIEEYYDGEIGELFLSADKIARDYVTELSDICPITEDEIFLYRFDWMDSISIANKKGK